MRKKLLHLLMIVALLAPLFSTTPALAVGGTVRRIVVTRSLSGQAPDVTVYDSGWVTDRVEFDIEYGVAVTIYAQGGTADWYYQLINGNGYNGTWNGPDTSHAFYPWPPIQSCYQTFVDGNWAGAPGDEFCLVAVYPDLEASPPQPDNGASSPPFCVGQTVDWYTTVTNQGRGEAGSTDVGYYVGTSSNDYSNRFASDSTGTLAPNGGPSVEHEPYTFSSADVGTRYLNVWADYQDNLAEDNDNDNKNSYGPFSVEAAPVAEFTADQASGTRPRVS